MVLLNDLGGLQRSWNRIAALLVDRYRVLTFDHRGHGHSSAGSGYSVDLVLDDIRAVIQASSLTKPAICGWYSGADLAVLYAARHPESVAGVLAVDGGVPTGPCPDDIVQEARQFLAAPMTRFYGAAMRALRRGVDIGVEENFAFSRDFTTRTANLLDAYRRITVPVQVRLGAIPDLPPDAWVPSQWPEGARQLTRHHPEVDVRWLDSPIDRPALAGRLIEDFLAQIPRL